MSNLSKMAKRLRQTLYMVIVFVFLSGVTVAQLPSDGASLSDRLRHGPGVRNHSVGIKPSKAVSIPADWPLAFDGSITCLTCHDQLPDLTRRSGPHLRDTNATNQAEFCSKCHINNSTFQQNASHWAVIGRAHQSTKLSRNSRSDGLMDSSSRQCLGCHDGVNASNATNGHANNLSMNTGRSGSEHAVGVRYQKQRSRGRFVSLRHESQLPKEILLPQGQVSCISCHDLYAATQARLTIPIENSALCMACHPMNE